MIRDFEDQALLLYPEYSRVYGPYSRKDDRKVVVFHAKGSDRTTTRQYSKVLLEIKLGRRLVGDETVDHKDEDKTNDSIENLQLLSRDANLNKSANHQSKKISLVCPQCGASLHRPPSRVRKQNFCSNSCRSRFQGANQYGNKKKGYVKSS